mmetsp:Transcript_6748/g.15587  ORF Transcript_6748/g.15587 Transcript_6748/m.15587 type:complete len:288 (+) Transcript_6748:62-925(+)
MPLAPHHHEVKLEELSRYFHLPEKVVAKELGICLTSLKKLCRSYGISRWPFRKLKSLERTLRKVRGEDGISPQISPNQPSAGNGVLPVVADPAPAPKDAEEQNPASVDDDGGQEKMSDGSAEQPDDAMSSKTSYSESSTPEVLYRQTCFMSPRRMERSSGVNSKDASGARMAVPTRMPVACEKGAFEAVVAGPVLVLWNWSQFWEEDYLRKHILLPLSGLSLKLGDGNVRADLEFDSYRNASCASHICRAYVSGFASSVKAGRAVANKNELLPLKKRFLALSPVAVQ